MHYKRRPFDSVSVSRRTDENLRHVRDIAARLGRYEADAEKDVRLGDKKHLCRYCYYYATSRIGGSAVTSSECSLCDNTLHSGNTCIDLLCLECAKRNNLCQHCGADTKDRVRRREPITSNFNAASDKQDDNQAR